MCVIPVYYISAPGQNENEYSQMRAPAHTQQVLLKSINADRAVLPSLRIQCAADDATSEQSLVDPGHTFVMCTYARRRYET